MIELLEFAADALGEIVAEVVFVGGATIPSWMTSASARALRATDDVDAVGEAVSYVAFAALEERLRARGRGPAARSSLDVVEARDVAAHRQATGARRALAVATLRPRVRWAPTRSPARGGSRGVHPAPW